MKILMINKFLYLKGGDAIVTLGTGELLRARGHEVAYWGMKNEKDPAYPHRDLFVGEVDLNSGGGIKQQLKIAGNMLYSLEAKTKVEKLIKRIGKPDIVHLHNFAHQISPSILHVFKKHKIPCVMTMHDYKLVCASYTLLSHGKLCEKCAGGAYINCFREGCVKDSRAKSLLNTLEMYLHHSILHIYDLVDVFISPSRFLKDKVEEMGFKGRVVHLPNFVNCDEFTPRFEAKERCVVYCGRLSKEKGISTLISAVRGTGVPLKIIGDGPIKEALKRSVEKERLTNVQFLGYLTGEDLKDQIRRAAAVVVPSEWYENNPRSVIESFALGTPVIGARIGGIPELVKDGETGMTFEPGNAGDLREKISDMTGNPDKAAAMGKTARQLVEKELNPEKHYTQLMAIYESVGR